MKHKLSKIIFICALIACVGLRVYLKLAVIDPATGYYEGNLFPAAVFNTVLAAAVLALFVLGFRKKTAESFTAGMPLRVLAFLAGVAALLVSGWEILATIDGMSETGLNAAMIALLFRLCGVASGFVLIAVALRLRADGSCGVSPALLLLPAVWQIHRLLTSFMAYTAMRSVSDQLLDVLTMVLLVPFLLAHGRVLGNVGREKGLRQTAIFGLPFALLAISSSVGVVVAFFAGRAVPFAASLPQALFYPVMGVYAAMFTFSAGGGSAAVPGAEPPAAAE